MDLLNRLKSMKVVPCQEYVDALAVSGILSWIAVFRLNAFVAPGKAP